MASYLSTTAEVHVLLVEHDASHLISTKQMLESFSYKDEKAQVDIVMANINSLDTCAFMLLQEAVKMDLLVILMCDYDDDMMARSALEEGAFLFLKKPVKKENVMYVWQHLWREKTLKIKEKEQLREMVAFSTKFHGFVAQEEVSMETVMSQDNNVVENGNESGKEVRSRKVRTEWTQELHDKFVDAVIQLGEGRCYPKEILEFMNVPGLTRTQVASHLQKCRTGSWRPPGDRNCHNGNFVASHEIEATKSRPKKFGSMPVLTKHPEQQNLQIQENTNNVFDHYPQLPQVESLQDLSGYTFAQEYVARSFTEHAGTNLEIVPDSSMPNEPLLFYFNSVTSRNLQAFDIDQLYWPG